ncbi:winged helix-turn-helix domain-containing protein [Kribbella sp. CA-293567]|uniref:winged helix-turn-helix domain-containing protein n=1 Tax=Kribbella sp. CA-293567 TaxID=3002436 RepID=UPI0022DE08E5|nr:helix-turn-helix domain-containing protein [Kribbella sp. CA-293567]WBQ02852.1 helix-turn-helix domain-containing protein [Kribbella sp. CA-293567]
MSEREVHHGEELKALTHPLRLRMLAALREDGPATATELARRFATDTGATSYHLRKLAQYGFVEEAAVEGHPRARHWQAVHSTTSWKNTEVGATSEGRTAADWMRRQQAGILQSDVESFEQLQDSLPAEWIDAAGIGDQLVRLTPESVNQLWERFYSHLEELKAADAGDPAARRVSVVVSAFPRPEPS